MRTVCRTSILVGTFVTSSSLDASSAAFLRSLSRATKNDAADRAVYSPASSAHVTGCQSYLSNLSALRRWDIRTVDDTYDTRVTAPIVPEVHVSCGRSGLGFYAALFPSGGSALFAKGLPSSIKEMQTTLKTGIQNQSLQTQLAGGATLVADPEASIRADERNAHLHIGAAYAVNDNLALSFGLTPIFSQKTVDARLRYRTVLQPSPTRDYGVYSVHYHQKASGIAPLASFNYRSGTFEGQLQFEGRVPLAYRTQVERDDTADIAVAAGMEPTQLPGQVLARDKPATLTLGLGQSFGASTLRSELSYQFTKAARDEVWQQALAQKAMIYNNPQIGTSADRQNAWSAAVSWEQPLSVAWLLSFGLMYSDGGSSAAINIDEQHPLDAYTYAGGARYRVSEATAVDLAYLRIDSIDAYNQDKTEVYRIQDHVLALGLARTH